MKPLNDRDFRLFVESAEKLVEPGAESRAHVVHALALVMGQAPEPERYEGRAPGPLEPFDDMLMTARTRGLRLARIEQDAKSGLWRCVWLESHGKGNEISLGASWSFRDLVFEEMPRIVASGPEVKP